MSEEKPEMEAEEETALPVEKSSEIQDEVKEVSQQSEDSEEKVNGNTEEKEKLENESEEEKKVTGSIEDNERLEDENKESDVKANGDTEDSEVLDDENKGDAEKTEEQPEPEEAKSSNKRKNTDEEETEIEAKKAKTEDVISFYVGGLPPPWSSARLREFFEEENGIELLDSRKHTSRKYGHIDLKNPEDEDKVAKLDGEKVENYVLKIDRAASRKKEPPVENIVSVEVEDNKSNVLFVKNIAKHTTEETLMEFFTPDGAKTVRINRKGYAFVEFETVDQASEALKLNQGRKLDGIRLCLDKSYEIGASSGSKTLFVRNLSLKTTEEDMKSLFNTAVNVRRPHYTDSGNPKTFAFLDFDSVEDAKDAMDKHQRAELSGQEIQIAFDLAPNPGTPKPDRHERSRSRKERFSDVQKRQPRGHGRRDRFRDRRDRYRRDDDMNDDFRGRREPHRGHERYRDYDDRYRDHDDRYGDYDDRYRDHDDGYRGYDDDFRGQGGRVRDYDDDGFRSQRRY